MWIPQEAPKNPLIEIIKPIIVIEQKVEAPVIVEIKDPNNCEPAMYWASEAPYYCIPKQSSNSSARTTERKPEPVKNAPRATSGNTYSPGYCTFYAKSMRSDLPNNLGNARTWASRASSQGIPTGTTPRSGSIGQYGNHVVYVNSVNENGTFNLTEMNYKGRNIVSTRSSVSPSGWMFIY